MKEFYHTLIVGGGFSGLISAVALAEKGKDVAIIERLDRVGKKILSTGNGRGNLTNEVLTIDNYHGNDVSFAEYALCRYDNKKILEFFSSLCVPTVSENGRIYPASMQASSLLDALRLNADSLGVKVFTEKYVSNIAYDKKSQLFTLLSEKCNFLSKNVVLCCGGAAAPNFGTDGTSYSLAKAFGHKITKLSPSLCRLISKSDNVKGLKGIKHNAKVGLYDDYQLITATKGDILFTDNGVSGNTIFYLSAYLSALKKPIVKIEFLPEYTFDELLKLLKQKHLKMQEFAAETLLNGIVHSQLSKKICKMVAPYARLIKDFTENQLSKAVKLLKSYEVYIDGDAGFINAQVTKGGVSTEGINDKTMESKLQKNLYFCGEMIDIDGDCGGYNLQWAFSSAMCAAEAINEDI